MSPSAGRLRNSSGHVGVTYAWIDLGVRKSISVKLYRSSVGRTLPLVLLDQSHPLVYSFLSFCVRVNIMSISSSSPHFTVILFLVNEK